MKIRMKENTLRLRLSQAETEQFGRDGKVSTITRFGSGSDSFISYSLEKGEIAKAVFTTFNGSEIKVIVPGKLADEWAFTSLEGFEENVPLNDGQSLYVLVEKDLHCLHKRVVEDDSDSFPNSLGKGKDK